MKEAHLNISDQFDKQRLSAPEYMNRRNIAMETEQKKLEAYEQTLLRQFEQDEYEDYEVTKAIMLMKRPINLHAATLTIQCISKLFRLVCETLDKLLVHYEPAQEAKHHVKKLYVGIQRVFLSD